MLVLDSIVSVFLTFEFLVLAGKLSLELLDLGLQAFDLGWVSASTLATSTSLERHYSHGLVVTGKL